MNQSSIKVTCAAGGVLRVGGQRVSSLAMAPVVRGRLDMNWVTWPDLRAGMSMPSAESVSTVRVRRGSFRLRAAKAA